MSKFSMSVNLADLLGGEYRLDAGFYATDVARANATLNAFAQNGGELATVGELSSGTFNPPPIKRVFTDDEKKGTPYMLPQEMYDFYWRPKKYVLTDRMPDIGDWFLHAGWVVLSQSGTVGKPYFATRADEKVVLSQNAIRVPTKDPEDGGFLYAYLSTWIGQALLRKDKFGITVKHIRPHQVDSVTVPVVDKRKRARISSLVKESFELRARAIALLDQAKKEIYSELGAPERIDESDNVPDDADVDV